MRRRPRPRRNEGALMDLSALRGYCCFLRWCSLFSALSLLSSLLFLPRSPFPASLFRPLPLPTPAVPLFCLGFKSAGEDVGAQQRHIKARQSGSLPWPVAVFGQQAVPLLAEELTARLGLPPLVSGSSQAVRSSLIRCCGLGLAELELSFGLNSRIAQGGQLAVLDLSARAFVDRVFSCCSLVVRNRALAKRWSMGQLHFTRFSQSNWVASSGRSSLSFCVCLAAVLVASRRATLNVPHGFKGDTHRTRLSHFGSLGSARRRPRWIARPQFRVGVPDSSCAR